jgi:hypothetical protein
MALVTERVMAVAVMVALVMAALPNQAGVAPIPSGHLYTPAVNSADLISEQGRE